MTVVVFDLASAATVSPKFPATKTAPAVSEEQDTMSVSRFSVSLVGIVGLVTAAVAGAMTWLLLTDPVRTADAASHLAQGNLSPFMRAIGGLLYGALQGLFSFL